MSYGTNSKQPNLSSNAFLRRSVCRQIASGLESDPWPLGDPRLFHSQGKED